MQSVSQIFMHILQLLRVSVCILIAVEELKMNNTTVILPYIQHKFSSMKLCFWVKLQRFIFVNSLLSALNIIMKDSFSSPVMVFLRNESFLYFGYVIVLIFSLRYQMPSLLTFPIFFKWWQIGMCWSQLLTLNYFCMDCFPPILLKHLS